MVRRQETHSGVIAESFRIIRNSSLEEAFAELVWSWNATDLDEDHKRRMAAIYIIRVVGPEPGKEDKIAKRLAIIITNSLSEDLSMRDTNKYLLIGATDNRIKQAYIRCFVYYFFK